MKSKFIFIAMLFSLLLNIFHDFMVTHQVEPIVTNIYDCTEEQTVLSSQCNNQLDEMHHVFHYHAIFLNIAMVFPQRVTTQPLFVAKNPPFVTYDTSFKPPKA